MFSSILVAIDDSETARHALEQAIALARTSAARLRIVHVVDMGWLPVGPEIAIDVAGLRAARRVAGETIVGTAGDAAGTAGIRAEAAGVETDSPTQDVAEAIASEASRWGADLVVLGTHGRRGFRRLLLGSVAERVARLMPAPVLLVPRPEASATR